MSRADDDLGALMYTGGTTGRSKGVMLSHANLWWCGKASQEKGVAAGMDVGRSLVPLPLSHAFGMIVTIVGAHREGAGQSTLMRWFDPAGWLQLAQDHRVEAAPLVPSMLTMLLQQRLEDYDLSSLQYVNCGSAPLSIAALEEWERRVPGSMVLNGYGCTESGAVICTSTATQRKIGTVGTPIPYLELEIRDDDDRPLPAGEIGEVCCKSPGVMQGYWKAPDVTATTLRDGWLHTGDVGVVDEDGYLTLVDRKKDLIIRGGFNVYPRDVEDELMTHPVVAMAAVIGRPDPKMGEEVVAYVSLRPDTSATAEELIAYAKERLAANKYPREVHILDAIPLTSVGKTDRKRCASSRRTNLSASCETYEMRSAVATRRDQQHDDRSDQGTQHAAPVEYVGVADAEADGEDQVTDHGATQADPSETARLPAQAPEGVGGNENPGDDPAEWPSRSAPITMTSYGSTVPSVLSVKRHNASQRCAGAVQRRHVQVPFGVFRPSTFLSNFPTLVLGTSGMNAQRSGSCHFATRSARNARSVSASSVAPSRTTTDASGRSCQRSSGTATTAASSTSGCAISWFSNSTELIHSPPDLMTSLVRSVICMKPR